MRQPILYTARLLKFAFGLNPALYFALLLSLLSVTTELAAMSSLLPLTTLAFGQTLSASGRLAHALAHIGLRPTFETFVTLFVGLFVLRLLTQLASQGMAMNYGRKLMAQLASRAFQNIVKQASLKEIEKNSIGYFITLAGDESFRASTIVISISQLLAATALAILYFVAIAVYSQWTAIGVGIFMLMCGVALLGALRRSQALGNIQIEQSRSAGSLFLDALNGLRTVRALSAEGFVTTNYRIRMFEYVRTLFRIDFINLLSRITPATILLFGFLGMVLFVPSVGAGRIAPATLATTLILLIRFFPTTGEALGLLMRIIADTKAARDVLAVSVHPYQDTQDTLGRDAVAGLDPVHTVTIRNLSFSHRPTRPVFSQFSVEFKAGRSYALIGPSGSGKSTLFDLLLGFYPFESGDILINGIPIQRLPTEQLRNHVLLVGQQTVIFNDTVENNVRFGYAASSEAVEKACRLACIHDVIRQLPSGYQTVLSYQGTNLSGGQKQRIGVARALLRQPQVLLLDEVTAGLDHATRDEIISNVLSEFQSRTVILSTHDRELASRVDQAIAIAPLSWAEDAETVSNT